MNMRGMHRVLLSYCNPPVERPDAVTDENSDDDDTNDINHLPRRILIAEATFKKKALRLNCSAATQKNAGLTRAKETERIWMNLAVCVHRRL